MSNDRKKGGGEKLSRNVEGELVKCFGARAPSGGWAVRQNED